MADLNKLSQREASAILGLNARAIRDDGTIPRSGDGTYDAADLVKWARGRSTSPADIPDAALEKLLCIADHLWMPCDTQIPAALESIAAVRAKHGDAALVALVDAMLDRWRSVDDWQSEVEQSPEMQRQQAERERKQRLLDSAREGLRLSFVCDGCQKIRKGRKWVVASVPADHAPDPSMCPDCKPF